MFVSISVICSHISNPNVRIKSRRIRNQCRITTHKHTHTHTYSLLQDNYFIRAEKVEVKPKEERDKEDAKKVPKDETSLAEKTKSGKQGNKNKGQTTPDSPQTSKEVPFCYSY